MADPHVVLSVRQWLSSEGAASPLTLVSEPREVACFSRAPDRSIAFGSRAQLARFRDPVIGAPLDAGFHTYVPKDESGGFGCEPIVECLRGAGFDISVEADIVTYRNNLNKIGGCPVNLGDAFEFDAVCVGRTVFLDVRRGVERKVGERERRFMYMGYKFEAMCSEGVRDGAVVDANAEFCAAMRLRIGNHRVLLMAEMDGEMGQAGASGKNSYVELKTSKQPFSDRDFDTLYLRKYPKFFLQSYLAGIRTLFIGFRDEQGRLADVDHVATRSLHKKSVAWRRKREANGARNLPPAWEPTVCVNFIEYVVEQARKACTANVGKTIHFAYDPRSTNLVGTLTDDKTFAARMTNIIGQNS